MDMNGVARYRNIANALGTTEQVVKNCFFRARRITGAKSTIELLAMCSGAKP